MRFVVGPPPQADDFDPETDGWRQLREFGPGALQLFGSLIGILLCAVFIFAWTSLAPITLSFHLDLGISGPWGFLALIVVVVLSPILFAAGVIIAHEFIHALATPKMGLSCSTVIGVWPSCLMPYAAYLDEMSPIRFALVALAPLIVLSIGPLAVCFATGNDSAIWRFVSCFNALASGGDVLLAPTVLCQVPLFAKIRNKGWNTWWKAA